MPKTPAYESASLLPPNFHDIRDQAAALAKKSPNVRKKDSGRTRDWAEVTGICLHQTAVVLGERVGRWASLGAHLGVTRSGKIIWVHDFDKIIYHGNGFNNRTIGIEIDGRYEGVEGDRRTFWRPEEGKTLNPTPLTDECIEAAKAAIRWAHDYVERRGGDLKVLVAHRQSSSTRRSDPGSAIWQRVALPMASELELGDGGKDFQIGSGRPIPESWDPTKTGVPY